jgi:hypothetical protein
MATSGRGSGVVGYKVQLAVDTEHHFIIAHDVTNCGSDRAGGGQGGTRRVASQTVTRSQVPSRFQLADIFSPIRLNGRFCQVNAVVMTLTKKSGGDSLVRERCTGVASGPKSIGV